MAGLDAICTALADTIKGAIPDIRVYPIAADAAAFPAISIELAGIDYQLAYQRGLVAITLKLPVMTSGGTDAPAIRSLYDLLSPEGARSVWTAIFNARTLGLDGTDAHATEASELRGEVHMDGSRRWVADLTVIVHTKPGV